MMSINPKLRSNKYVSQRMISITFLLILTVFIGVPALISGIFTIPGAIGVWIAYMYVQRSRRAFESEFGISVSAFHKAVWKDKENRTLEEIIDAYLEEVVDTCKEESKEE